MDAKLGSGGALAGVRVVDLTRVLGGPYATQCLADHGADVIKIEPPQGDETRGWAPFKDGESAYFSGVNRNKRNAAVDLSVAEGREILFRLLASADILIHNFKSGTLERWGMGYGAVLSARFPQLIYCHITGFGEEGPMGGLPGYDAVVQALSGCMSVNGSAESGPTRIGVPLVDIGTGLNAVIAILLALVERNRSGLGQKLDVALYDSALAFLHPHAVGLLQTGQAPRRTGNAHASVAPYEQYKTGSGLIFLAIGNNGQFEKLCAVLDRPELTEDSRFRSNADRVVHRAALRKILEPLLLRHSAEELSMSLLRIGVPAGVVREVKEVLNSAHTAHRDMVVEFAGYKGIGIPIKLGRTPGSVRYAPQGLGESTREICREIGISDSEIANLVARKIVTQAGDESP